LPAVRGRFRLALRRGVAPASFRRWLAASCLVLLPFFAFAAPKPATAGDALARYPAAASGEYVIYRDNTWKRPTWVGFLCYDDSTYGAFGITPETKSNVAVLFRCETVDGKLTLTGQNVISQITQDDVPMVNYLMALLPDLFAWRQAAPKDGKVIAAQPSSVAQTSSAVAPVRSDLLPPAVQLALVTERFGGAVSVEFAPETPLFSVRALTSAAGKPLLSLERAGRLDSDGEASFFSFTPRPEVKAGAGLTLAATRKAAPRTVDGVKLKLDDQWTAVADNTFFLGNAAVLIVDTLDLSAFKASSGDLPLALTRRFSLSSPVSWADPNALRVSGTAARFVIENRFYDPELGTQNRDFKLCLPAKDGKTVVVANLSVSETAYQSNRAYFDALF
jgi:hypothetical protein